MAIQFRVLGIFLTWAVTFGACFLIQDLDRQSEAKSCVEYIPGDINLIITVPHGGLERTINCSAKRQPGCFINGKCQYDRLANCTRDEVKCRSTNDLDGMTIEISKTMRDTIIALKNKKPHLIIMKCIRSGVDVNRPKDAATQGCPASEVAYDEYHGRINSTIASFKKQPGLLIDLHGHGHKTNSTEIAYGISKEAINKAVNSTTNSFDAGDLKWITIENLRSRLVKGSVTNWDVIVGGMSLGRYLEDQGFEALPGPKQPKPGQADYEYYDGGHTIRTYDNIEGMNAIQMEGPSSLRTNATMRDPFARGLANAVINFWQAYFE